MGGRGLWSSVGLPMGLHSLPCPWFPQAAERLLGLLHGHCWVWGVVLTQMGLVVRAGSLPEGSLLSLPAMGMQQSGVDVLLWGAGKL